MNGRYLPPALGLDLLLQLSSTALQNVLNALSPGEEAQGSLLAPIEEMHEVWASGVTYLRSREARKSESTVGNLYERIYEAERPELFFKAVGWRVVGPRQPVRVRTDSRWSVPEPELVLVINRHLEIVGYTAGNDMSSRDLEGENPLYLPQAKTYTGSCSLGPAIRLCRVDDMRDLPIRLEIVRGDQVAYVGETRTSRMKRGFEELVNYLGRELDFPHGVFLMTGTGIVPPDEFSLVAGDRIRIEVGELVLENEVTA
jgi:2-dehydro-3-deoxy-D-arabinonate dehydratase